MGYGVRLIVHFLMLPKNHICIVDGMSTPMGIACNRGTALTSASFGGSVEVVKLLLGKESIGVNIKEFDDLGNSFVHGRINYGG